MLAMFKSRTFAQQVIQENQLMKNPDFLSPRADGRPYNEEEGIGALTGMLRVTIRAGTRFIDVGVMHSKPRMAKELADMLANNYIRQTVQQREATSNLVNEYLEKKPRSRKKPHRV